MADRESQSSTSNITKRGDGTTLEQSDAPRNPMKRMMETAQQPANEVPKDSQPRKQPAIRGDGTVLPDRNEQQPRNPMKRMMDTSQESDGKEL
jgi:hypothetical protein